MLYKKREDKYYICRITTIRNAVVLNVSPDGVRDLDLVLRKLTEQQALVIGWSLVGIIFYFLVTIKVLVVRYYIYSIFLLLETVSSLSFLISFGRTRKRGAASNNTSGGNNSGGLIADVAENKGELAAVGGGAERNEGSLAAKKDEPSSNPPVAALTSNGSFSNQGAQVNY